MHILDTLITGIGQENDRGDEAKFAFFEECEIVVSPFGKSGAKDFAIFLVNHDLGFEVVLFLFGRIIGLLFFFGRSILVSVASTMTIS